MRMPSHLFIALTVALTVYSQLVMRWQISVAPPAPQPVFEKLLFVASLLLRPWVLSAVAATFFSGLCWMAALTRFPLSYAFPFMALNFVLVAVASAILFDEPLTATKIGGNLLIVAGVLLLAAGQR
jgi:drug/metabolite transporter (DMT)-like permease